MQTIISKSNETCALIKYILLVLTTTLIFICSCSSPVSPVWDRISGDWMITDNDESYRITISATDNSFYFLSDYIGSWCDIKECDYSFVGDAEDNGLGIYTQSHLTLKIVNDTVIIGHIKSFNQYKGKSWYVEYDFVGNKIK